MFAAFFVAGGALWCLAYLLIIRVSLRDRSFGMPLLAVGVNLSWEFVYSFVHPYPGGLQPAVIAWLVIDLGIVYVTLRYAPREFPGLSRFQVNGIVLLSVAAGLPLVLAMHEVFGDPWGVHSAYLDDVMYGCMFLAMLHSRQSSRGQTVGIAVCKLLGTGMISVAFVFFPPLFAGDPMLRVLALTSFALGAIYLVALLRVVIRERSVAARGGGHRPLPRQKVSDQELSVPTSAEA